MHDDGVRARLGVEEPHLLVVDRRIQAEFVGRRHVPVHVLPHRIGPVILDGKVLECVHLEPEGHDQHTSRHGPFLLVPDPTAPHALGRSQPEGQEQGRETPFEHDLSKGPGDHQGRRVHPQGAVAVVQRVSSGPGAQQDGQKQDEQNHILEEALVRSQGNGIAEATAAEHALVGNLHLDAILHDGLATKRIAVVRVPREPGEKQHEDQGQGRRQPRQGSDEQGHAEQDLADGRQHAQLEGPRCPGLEVEGSRLEILLQLVHEAEGIVDLDQAGNDEQGADEHAADVGDGKQNLAHGGWSRKVRSDSSRFSAPLTGD